MMELLIISIALVIFVFIIYSTYSAQCAKFSQRKRAYELKEMHMTKSMDRMRSEISQIEKEIKETEDRLSELDNNG